MGVSRCVRGLDSGLFDFADGDFSGVLSRAMQMQMQI